MSLKIAIFTAIFGGKDELKEPLKFINNENIDYFLITDDSGIESKYYQIIYKEPNYNDITKNARYYKINGLDLFNKYDYVIWHDANIQMNHREILNLVSFASNTDLAFFRHPERDCIYEEAIKCVELEKDYPYKLFNQILKYFLAGVKNNVGLYATGLYIKNNLLTNDAINNKWWLETKRHSRRDQISLSYCLNKFQIAPEIIEGDIRNNVFSCFHKHKHSRYEFLKENKKKSISKIQKKIIIRLIIFLKKLNLNGI